MKPESAFCEDLSSKENHSCTEQNCKESIDSPNTDGGQNAKTHLELATGEDNDGMNGREPVLLIYQQAIYEVVR